MTSVCSQEVAYLKHPDYLNRSQDTGALVRVQEQSRKEVSSERRKMNLLYDAMCFDCVLI